MLLRLQAEFSGPESVLLGHGPLGALETVQDQLAEEGIPDAPGDGYVLLAVLVDQVYVITAGFPGHVGVFAQFDVAFCAKHERPAVTPGAQAVRAEPVDPAVSRRAVA